MAETVRAVARYSGWVQGVGFRFTTRRAAAGFAVAGYVRNLPGGDVEVVAEGTRQEIEAFLAAVRRAMARHIDDFTVQWAGATGEYTGFGVRF